MKTKTGTKDLHRPVMATLVVLLTLAATTVSIVADPFKISRWTIDSGGGTSEGDRFRVTGTIGQPESGASSSGGRFTVTSGFWNAIRVIQTDGLPELKIVRAGPRNVVLSWTTPENGTALTVEESADLSPGSWRSTDHPIFSAGDNRQIIIPGATGRSFFRLKK